MHNDLLATLALVTFLGIASQLIAWRVGVPSILLLLAIGIIAGPLTGWVNVNGLLGDLLFPIVSLSVAIILFEGGLSLRLGELRQDIQVVWRLILVGVPFTWLVTAASAYFILGLHVETALLLGAVLVVTGPTVIIPLLKQIRPAARVSSILRWEGIVIDPVGAVLAVLVFEEILVSSATDRITVFIATLIRTIIIGGVGGWLAAQFMIGLYNRYIVPYSLQNPATLMFVIVAFTLSNLLQAESGLVTVTVMGFFMANQNRVDLRHIIEFKENLQVLLISLLFILLAARLQVDALQIIGWEVVAFIAVIIFITRPLSVYLATIGSGFNWRERLFIGWMAPRGIVAAAVSSIFAVELSREGFTADDPELLVSYTFAVIIATVTIYSLTAGLLARLLNLTERYPQGVLMLGAQSWARRIGGELQRLGFRVIMADSNPSHIQAAQQQDLETYYGNILSEVVLDELNLGGVGRLLALTPNHEVNSLASLHFRAVFDKDEVYQLVSNNGTEKISGNLSGRGLFGADVTYDHINRRFQEGAEVATHDVEDDEQAQQIISTGQTPLFVVRKNHQLDVWTVDTTPAIEAGDKIVTITTPTKTNLYNT